MTAYTESKFCSVPDMRKADVIGGKAMLADQYTIQYTSRCTDIPNHFLFYFLHVCVLL